MLMFSVDGTLWSAGECSLETHHSVGERAVGDGALGQQFILE